MVPNCRDLDVPPKTPFCAVSAFSSVRHCTQRTKHAFSVLHWVCACACTTASAWFQQARIARPRGDEVEMEAFELAVDAQVTCLELLRLSHRRMDAADAVMDR